VGNVAQQGDGTGREERRDQQPLHVPRLKSAAARSVHYEKPRRFVSDGREHTESEVVEIDVETDAEFPIAGIGPALFVGDAVIVDSERVGERTYRFYAPASAALEEGALVALGRAGTGVPRPEHKRRIRLEWRDRP
jgi:hypothetical protein